MKKKAVIVPRLLERGKFDQVYRLQPPSDVEFLPSPWNFKPFESTKSTTDYIIDALKDDECNAIALYSIKGIGKTTLVKEVGKKSRGLKLFDKITMFLRLLT